MKHSGAGCGGGGEGRGGEGRGEEGRGGGGIIIKSAEGCIQGTVVFVSSTCINCCTAGLVPLSLCSQ